MKELKRGRFVMVEFEDGTIETATDLNNEERDAITRILAIDWSAPFVFPGQDDQPTQVPERPRKPIKKAPIDSKAPFKLT